MNSKMPEEAWKYKNEWIVLSYDLERVVGHGATPQEAENMAKSSGERGVLFFIPEEWPDVLVL